MDCFCLRVKYDIVEVAYIVSVLFLSFQRLTIHNIAYYILRLLLFVQFLLIGPLFLLPCPFPSRRPSLTSSLSPHTNPQPLQTLYRLPKHSLSVSYVTSQDNSVTRPRTYTNIRWHCNHISPSYRQNRCVFLPPPFHSHIHKRKTTLSK